MIHRSRSVALLATLAVAGGAIWAQTPPQTPSEPLVKQDFKDGQGGWVTFGPTATIAVSHDAPIVTAGQGALKFGYTVNKGDMSALIFPVQKGTLTRAKSLRLRVRTDTTTEMVVALQEEGGGRYIALCMAPKDAWQPIELSVDDFVLSDGPNDPKDPDGKLDMDQVSGIMVSDLAQMFAQSDDEGLKSLLGVHGGSHSLFLDEFSVSPDALPTSVATKGTDILLETFTHPQLAWYPLGGGDLVRASGGPIQGNGLKYTYRQSPSKVSLIAHSIGTGTLTGAKSISLDFGSQQPAKLIIQVEQTDGGKFSTPVDLEGGPMPKHAVLSFDSFTPSGDSQVTSGKPTISSRQKRIPRIGTTGTAGTRNGRDASESLRRR